MGRTEKRELISRLTVLLLHLLKWRHQSGKRGPSWEASIANQRDDIADHLDDNPSLKPLLPQALASAYRKASRRRSPRRVCRARPSPRLVPGRSSRSWAASSGRSERVVHSRRAGRLRRKRDCLQCRQVEPSGGAVNVETDDVAGGVKVDVDGPGPLRGFLRPARFSARCRGCPSPDKSEASWPVLSKVPVEENVVDRLAVVKSFAASPPSRAGSRRTLPLLSRDPRDLAHHLERAFEPVGELLEIVHDTMRMSGRT